MKRLTPLLLLLALLATPTAAKAEPLPFGQPFDFLSLLAINKPAPEFVIIPSTPAEPPKPAPVVYTVVAGDNLISIGTAHNVEWQRLWAKNTQLTHPDVLAVGDQLTIPTADEVLARELPAAVSLPPTTPNVTTTRPSPSVQAIGGLFGARGYARAGGNCVNEPGVNSPRDGTNPISWAVLSYRPSIGATALWRGINHTGVVTGIWSNGDIEVRHQNWGGAPVTRFPASAFRGYR